MRRAKKLLKFILLAALILSVLCVPAFALDESEVEAAVAASSKEAVTGNVLIWFLCAVAFLKVSQKIDSFMASLGINVGHTGGSLLGDAMVTFRAATMATGGAGRILGGGRHGTGASAAGGASGSGSSSAGSRRILQRRFNRYSWPAHYQQRSQNRYYTDSRCPHRPETGRSGCAYCQ